jgi:hypothetical protein
MIPQEKAKELYLKFYIPDYCQGKPGLSSDWRIKASKKNAINMCDEMLKIQSCLYLYNTGKAFVNHATYWMEVKKEIENL